MRTLKATIGIAAWLSCILAGCVGSVKTGSGKQEFESKCAACHGLDGKGDGPQSPILPTKPANLTILAKENGGVFPAQRIYEIIDGRREVAAHGPRTMPIWGREFQVSVPDVPAEAVGKFDFRETAVYGRIKALVEYIARLQDTK